MESPRRLESCVLRLGSLRLDDAILEFGCLQSAVLDLRHRQINRHSGHQESRAADDHSKKGSAERGHRNLRAAKTRPVDGRLPGRNVPIHTQFANVGYPTLVPA
jgi:hypothetical protein